MRTLLVLSSILVALMFSNQPGLLLGPKDPIAADGSLQAGRALTLSEQKPVSERPMSDLDEPAHFKELFSKSAVEPARDALLDIAAAGPVLCDPGLREVIVAAIQKYYSIKRYLIAEYHFRGPRAAKFIDGAWSTAKDREIEVFVKAMLENGYLSISEISPSESSFLPDIVSRKFGANACERS